MAEDTPALFHLCYRIVTHKRGLTPDEIRELIKPESASDPAPPHRRVDPRAIKAHLLESEVPTFWTLLLLNSE